MSLFRRRDLKKDRSSRKVLKNCNFHLESLEERKLMAADVNFWGSLEIDGTPGNDTVVVTESSSMVNVFDNGTTHSFPRSEVRRIEFTGGSGNDYFANYSQTLSVNANGGDGNDRIHGGGSGDFLIGGNGDDYLYGNGGDDTIHGNDGNDVIQGHGGSDRLYGDNHNDRIYGRAGNDFIYGGGGADRLYGEADHDYLNGGDENDYLSGGTGEDRLVGGNGRDHLYGGNQDDQLYGGRGDDLLLGEGGDDQMFGYWGNDHLEGGGGDDLVDGGRGRDWLYGNSGADKLVAGDVGDVDPNYLFGGSGNDELIGGSGNDTLFGGEHDDRLFGRGGIDSLRGENGNDQLFGGAQKDWLFGGNGRDGLFGGLNEPANANFMSGGAGADRLLYHRHDPPIDNSRSNDVGIKFDNDDSAWTEREIMVVDQAFARLQERVGGDTWILKDSNSNNPLLFNKSRRDSTNSGFNKQWWWFGWHRRIHIRDWNEFSDVANMQAMRTVVHEIAHNWDGNFDEPNPFWEAFKGFNRISSDDDDFARSYGRTNDKEDLATVWEVALGLANGPDRPSWIFNAKLELVNRFLDGAWRT